MGVCAELRSISRRGLPVHWGRPPFSRLCPFRNYSRGRRRKGVALERTGSGRGTGGNGKARQRGRLILRRAFLQSPAFLLSIKGRPLCGCWVYARFWRQELHSFSQPRQFWMRHQLLVIQASRPTPGLSRRCRSRAKGRRPLSCASYRLSGQIGPIHPERHRAGTICLPGSGVKFSL